jgi:hypothetical protein
MDSLVLSKGVVIVDVFLTHPMLRKIFPIVESQVIKSPLFMAGNFSAPTMESNMEIPQKLKIALPYNPVISLLGTYPKKCASEYVRATCIPMFIAAPFKIPNFWKQPRCSISDEWIKKIWIIYTLEFYSVIKNSAILFEGKWIKLENFMSSKISQTQIHKGLIFS